MPKKIKSVDIFSLSKNRKVKFWRSKLEKRIKQKYPEIEFKNRNPDLIIVLGGDGTVLSAVHEYSNGSSLICGFNLGKIGFLTSVRNPGFFVSALDKILSGRYKMIKHLMLEVELEREGKKIIKGPALNDLVVESPLGMVNLKVDLEGYDLQYIRGSGLVVSTPTGSTAFNLSAHGPVVMPGIDAFILTELLDHNVPTPSVVVKDDTGVTVSVLDFKKKEIFYIKKSGENADVVLSIDGKDAVPLKRSDKISIKKCSKKAKFVEVEEKSFFKNLRDKFAFK